jgi:hypothetical protein
MTGIPVSNSQVMSTYEKVKQQLPTLTNLDTFLAAQQMGITQLTVAYCASLVDNNSARALFFPGFDFGAAISTAFNTDMKRDQIIEPLLQHLLADELPRTGNTDAKLLHQADPEDLRLELSQLIDSMTNCGGSCGANRTLTTVKATCSAALGSAVMLLQ